MISPPKPAQRGLDWQRIERWTAQIVADDVRSISRTFASHTAHAPTIRWNPEAAQLTTAPLRFLAQYWSGLPVHGDLPHVSSVDPTAMRPALGYVMLVDVIEHGHDFRYRLYGSIIARVSDADLTGRLLSTHHASSYVTEFGIATYRAAVQRRGPLYTERTPALAERTVRWQRLALPLVNDAGEITRFLAGTVPVSRDGRVITS